MDEIRVVSRNAIPPIQSVEHDGATREIGELRDFRWNALLRDFMPSSTGFSVSWVRLQRGEALELRAHGVQSLMVFYAGSGTMLGDLEGPVVKDDVVVVPAGCQHGFIGGPEGLNALSIQLGEELQPTSRGELADPQHGFGALMAYHQARLQEFKQRPLFDLLRDGTLEDPLKRRVFVNAVQSWFDSNLAVLLSRQACCSDPKYADAFLRELAEQSGPTGLCDAQSANRARSASDCDPALDAMTGWFTYQMFVLDNVEKVAIQLVSRSASNAYHNAFVPALAQYSSQTHVHLKHAATGSELLRHQSPRTYTRLRTIIGEAWDMFSALSDRIVELTRQA